MAVKLREFSVWCRVTWQKFVPGIRLFGRLTIRADRFVPQTTELVRVYPAGLGLGDYVSPDLVIERLLKMGYLPLAPEVLSELVRSRIKVRRRGYLVAPLLSGEQDCLMTHTGRLEQLDHALYVGTIENTGYSVIVARPA